MPLIVRCARDVLRGVEYLHGIKVVHRDIKPANILVFKEMKLKLGDFGLAREFSDDVMTVRNEVSTLWYRAPELIMGASTYNSKIDEWSVGVLILEMLLGRCPLMGNIEDNCTCDIVTHYNYNSDQLYKVFELVGTADDHFASRLDCYQHFKAWPRLQSRIEDIVSTACTKDRCRRSDKTEPSDEEVSQVEQLFLIIICLPMLDMRGHTGLDQRAADHRTKQKRISNLGIILVSCSSS